MQVPPAFSAVKVDGQRAYKRARDGEALTLAARPLWVEALLLTDRPDADHAELEMTCGKGGYVRAIARDLGAALGCHGHVTALRRLWSGPFRAEDGIGLAALEAEAKDPALDRYLRPVEAGLTGLPEVTCPAASLGRLRNGTPALVIARQVEFGEECWASHDGRAVAVGTYLGGEMHPTRVFA